VEYDVSVRVRLVGFRPPFDPRQGGAAPSSCPRRSHTLRWRSRPPGGAPRRSPKSVWEPAGRNIDVTGASIVFVHSCHRRSPTDAIVGEGRAPPTSRPRWRPYSTIAGITAHPIAFILHFSAIDPELLGHGCHASTPPAHLVRLHEGGGLDARWGPLRSRRGEVPASEPDSRITFEEDCSAGEGRRVPGQQQRQAGGSGPSTRGGR